MQGITFLDVLGIIFIILKLCGVIQWSWLWVLFPFWIGLAAATVYIFALYMKFGR